MNKPERSYCGTDILKGQDLTRELHEVIQGGRLLELINMTIDQLNGANSNYTFLKLGGIVATHNKDKVDFVEVCLIEEMSELTKVLCKIRRNEGDFNNTIEELGHVILMCYALISKYNFRYESVIKEAEDAVSKMKSSKRKKDLEEQVSGSKFDTVYTNYKYRMRGSKNENN